MDLVDFTIICLNFLVVAEYSSARPTCVLDPTGEAGVRTKHFLGSRVTYDLTNSIRDGTHFQVQFKTTDKSGLVIFAGSSSNKNGRKHKTNDAMAVYIANGHLHFLITCGNGYYNDNFNSQDVSDGKWHTLQFRRHGSASVEVKLDGTKIYTEYFIEKCEDFSKVYLGGLPVSLHFGLNYEISKHMRHSLDACLRNFHVGHHNQRFEDVPWYTAVSTCSRGVE